jgi:outer membrane lipoprotein SlyB
MCDAVRKCAATRRSLSVTDKRVKEQVMKTTHTAARVLITLICGLIAAGCGTTRSNDRPYSSNYASYGTIQSIEQVSGTRGSAIAGTVAGAAVGGVVGHQFGDGRGNDLATVAGVVGGAIVGHEIQQRAQERNADRNDYRIVVRMRDGSRRTFTESNAGNLHVGQDVSIVGDRIQM